MVNRAREYSPGSRSQRFRKFHRGKYVDERIAWVRTYVGQIVLMFYDEGTPIAESSNEPGPTIKVLLPQLNARTVHWDLSALTLDELNKMREFFNLAFDTAEPTVRMRDKVAADELAKGNDSFARIYRQVPQLVVRQRQEREHGESVLDGSENVSESGDNRGGESDSTSGGVRGSSSGMADAGEEESSGQDDGTETY